MRHYIKVVFFLIITSSPLCYAQNEDIDYGSNEAAGSYAQVNGINLYYEEYGHGKPLLLIHGNGSSISGMKAQIQHFSHNNRVIAVDSRGHGKSGLGAPQLSYRQIADDMIQLMSAMSIEEVSIIGWSDGGIVGLLMGIKAPNIIRKMALMAPNTRPASQSFYPEFVEILENQLEIVQGMIQKNNQLQDWLLARQHLLMMLNQPNISSEELKTITAPVLIIAGDKDGVTNKHIVEIFEGLQHGHLAIMPGETHFMPMSNPDLFNSLTSDFLLSEFKRPDSISIIKEHLGI